jgi:hypothetical protein
MDKIWPEGIEGCAAFLAGVIAVLLLLVCAGVCAYLYDTSIGFIALP